MQIAVVLLGDVAELLLPPLEFRFGTRRPRQTIRLANCSPIASGSSHRRSVRAARRMRERKIRSAHVALQGRSVHSVQISPANRAE